MIDAATWIARLRLRPHPEGGHYRETYRSAESIAAEALPARFGASRVLGTAIYYLLIGPQVSRLHRLRADEVWHHYAGSGLSIHVFPPEEEYRRLRLGVDLDRDQRPQVVIPAGCWFGATVDEPDGYGLVGCTLAPGFSFADFELARRQDLHALWPAHGELIDRLTLEAGE